MIFTGDSLSKGFSNNTSDVVLDPNGGNPGGAANITIGSGGWGSLSWNDSSEIVTGDIDWSLQNLAFDYKVNTTGQIFKFGISYWTGSSEPTLTEHEGVFTLNDDGAWHTHELDISDWGSDYQTAIDAGLDPNAPTNLRLRMQLANSNHDFLVDNVRVTAPVPEPSTYAAILGFLTIGLAFWHRRKS